MKNFIFALFILVCIPLSAQTWSADVAQITYNKCSKCHHSGGIAPFSLITYDDVLNKASMIQDAITSGMMPPSPPDESYQQYTHSNALTDDQKTTYLQWLNSGTPEGVASETPPPPVFSDGTLLGEGDLQVRIPLYKSKASGGQDDYACFSVPSGLTQDRIIKWVEIIPGNREIVHHALIYIDPLGTESTDTVGGDCSSPSNPATKLIAAYIPGTAPQMMPSLDPLKLGFSIPANSNIYFAMHYPEGSGGFADSTKVIFHFYPPGEVGVREVSADPIIQNWSFALPPNQVTTVNGVYNGINTDYSMLSVFPHMHLLGKTIKSYGVKPGGDTIPFVSIPDWDFHWQGFYFFKNIQHVPSGTVIRAKGTYDNTSSNPHNPSSPPVFVYPGLNTMDEMFLVYFHYLPYQAGDENYDLEALMQSGLQEMYKKNEDGWGIAPNPFDHSTVIDLKNAGPDDLISVFIYDASGKLIKRLCSACSGKQTLIWDGSNEQGKEVSNGLYHVSVNSNGKMTHKKLLKQ